MLTDTEALALLEYARSRIRCETAPEILAAWEFEGRPNEDPLVRSPLGTMVYERVEDVTP